MIAPTLFKLISRECFCPSGGPPLKQRYWWCSLCPDTQATGWSLSFTSHRAIRNKWPPLLLPSSALLQPHWLLALCECVRHIPALRALHGWSYLEVLLPGSHLTSFSYFSVLSLLLVRSSKSFSPLVQPHTPLYFSSWSLQLPIHYNVHLLILFSLLAVQSSLGISGQLAPGTSSDNKIHRCSSPFYNLCSICICQI